MKCPSCGNNQKVKEGLICGKCRYVFALNPKEPPGLSDGAMAGVVRRLSGPDGLAFTMDQFRMGAWRALARKGRLPGCLAVFITFFVGIPLSGFLAGVGFPDWLSFVAAGVLAVSALVLFNRRKPKIKAGLLDHAVRTYLNTHPPEQLVDGRGLADLTASALDEELVQYAPERILVVQHDDMVDMLVRNRFHFDHRTLVVSANKYPQAAFEACQKFLLRHPELPVCAAHDASRDGLRMLARLRKDLAWNLEDRPITDLGLHPKDIGKLKRAVWLPGPEAPDRPKAAIPVGGDPMERIEAGYRMPLGTASPRALIGGLSAAAVGGMALLSVELAAEMRDTRGSSAGTGFG